MIDLGAYINSDGIVTVEPNAPAVYGEGNGLLQTGHWHCIEYNLRGGKRLPKELEENIVKVIDGCRHPTLPFYWRSPHKNNPDDDASWDDLFGVIPMLYISRTQGYIDAMYRKLISTKWVMDIQNPDSGNLKYYLERFPHVPPFIRLSIGVATPLDHVIIACRMAYDGVRMGSYARNRVGDTPIRAYCLKTIAVKESLLCRLVGIFLDSRAKANGGWSRLWEPYYKSAEHPLVSVGV